MADVVVSGSPPIQVSAQQERIEGLLERFHRKSSGMPASAEFGSAARKTVMSSWPAKRRANCRHRRDAPATGTSLEAPLRRFLSSSPRCVRSVRRLTTGVVGASIEASPRSGTVRPPLTGQVGERSPGLPIRDPARPPFHCGMPRRLQPVLQKRQLVRPVFELLGQPLRGAEEQVRHAGGKWRVPLRSLGLRFLVLLLEPVAEAPILENAARRLNDRKPQPDPVLGIGRLKKLELIAVADDDVRKAAMLRAAMKLLASHRQREVHVALLVRAAS